MGLSDDQRAMLRMVAQRGEQGYEDIAALMGISVDEVRSRVAVALAELDAEGALQTESKQAAEAPPSAEPAPAVADSTAGAGEPASAAAEPQEPAAAGQPREPAANAGAEPPEPKPAGARRPSVPAGGVKLPSGPGMRAAIGAAVAIIALVAVILIVTGGGDDEESGTTTAAGATTAGETTAGGAGGGKGEAAANELTKATLTAVDGGKGKGVAIFGRVKKSLALEFAAQGLEPTGKGEAYTIWLSKNPQKMLPLASTKAPRGRIAAKFEVPVEVLAYLADETFTDLVLTRTADAQLTASLKAAAQEKTTPDYTGSEVLRGEVTGPIVGAQFRLEELKKEEEE